MFGPEVEVTVSGPDVGQVLAEAELIYRQVLRGRWGAGVDLVAPMFSDPVAAAVAFDALGRSLSAEDRRDAPAGRLVGGGDHVVWTGRRSVLVGATGLYMRLSMGQFSQLSWITTGAALIDTCETLRVEQQRPAGWPSVPHGHWSIGNPEVPVGAKVACDIYRQLDGRSDRPLLLGRAVAVTVAEIRPA